ncbi:MAG: SGNH/GDSL hydrolase family protein [Acidobacteriota bacterium]
MTSGPMTPKPMTSRREWLFRLLAMAVSTFMVLAFAEVALRLLGVGEPSPARLSDDSRFTFFDDHPFLGWDLVPGAVDRDKTSEYDIEIRISAEGLRSDRDFGPAPPTGMRRWLVLGDSFTFGHGVDVAAGWTSRLDALAPGAEVVNLAVTGYGTDQQLLRFEDRGPILGADAVVLGLFVGNVFRNGRSDQIGYGKPRFWDTGAGLEILNLPLPSHRLPPELPSGSRLGWLLSRRGGDALAHLGRGDAWPLTGKILERLRDGAADLGAPLFVVILPKDQVLYGGPHQRWLHGRAVAATRDLLTSVDVPYLDLTEALDGAKGSGERLYFPLDGHWTPAGHGVAAEAVASWLRGQGLPGFEPPDPPRPGDLEPVAEATESSEEGVGP